jgi:dTDP-4-amino-4,6-dideoxygalactose transaminase
LLEGTLARRYGSRSLILTDSGTSALEIALKSVIAQKPGTKVALPAYSCYNVATAAVGAGARIQLYDVDPRTLGPDFDSLDKALESGAKVVVVAHLYGVPVDMERTAQVCKAHNALLIEDAAQGADGRYRGRDLGSWGSISILSFGRGKGTTGGGGGALLSNDLDGRHVLEGSGMPAPASRAWKVAVGASAQWMLARPAFYRFPASMPFLKLGETVYQHPWEPAAIAEPSAAMLSVTLPLADAELRVRRANAERLSRSVSMSSLVEPVTPPAGAEPGYLRLPVIASGHSRPALLSRRARDLGIMPAYPKGLAELPQFRAVCANAEAGFPGADRLAKDLFTLPTHSLLSENDLKGLEALIGKPSR